MTTREAMTYLGISSSNFSRWQSTYGIPHVTVDGRRHFKPEDLDRARKQRDDNLRRWCSARVQVVLRMSSFRCIQESQLAAWLLETIGGVRIGAPIRGSVGPHMTPCVSF